MSFRLEPGQTLAVVGESGCGKSTLARVCALMEPPTAGSIAINGKPAAADRSLQLQNQMVFQNPYGSLNPRPHRGRCLGRAADHQSPRDEAGTGGAGPRDAGPGGPAS